jgi:hypothetical protein
MALFTWVFNFTPTPCFSSNLSPRSFLFFISYAEQRTVEGRFGFLGPISGEVGDGHGRGIAGHGHAGAPARRGCCSMQAYGGPAIPVLGHVRLLRRQLTMEAGSRWWRPRGGLGAWQGRCGETQGWPAVGRASSAGSFAPPGHGERESKRQRKNERVRERALGGR